MVDGLKLRSLEFYAVKIDTQISVFLKFKDVLFVGEPLSCYWSRYRNGKVHLMGCPGQLPHKKTWRTYVRLVWAGCIPLYI